MQIPLPVLESLQAAQGDLFALFVDTGREVLRAMMEQDRVALCGAKGKRLPERAAVRAGSTPSEVALGGQRITMRRLRARRADGELVLPSLPFAANRDPLDRRTWRAIARGVSTRATATSSTRCPRQRSDLNLEERGLAALSTERLRELNERPIGDLGIRAVLIDGIVFHDHTVLVALGVSADGPKHPVALREGAIENATVVKVLLEDLIDRGLSTEQATPFVIVGTGRRVSTDRSQDESGRALDGCVPWHRVRKIGTCSGSVHSNVAMGLQVRGASVAPRLQSAGRHEVQAVYSHLPRRRSLCSVRGRSRVGRVLDKRLGAQVSEV